MVFAAEIAKAIFLLLDSNAAEIKARLSHNSNALFN
jgi:hypothetical protein